MPRYDPRRIEPKYAAATTSYLVHLFSDLKRHDMGEALASPSAQGQIPARLFLTRPLWGLAETAPYLHDGSAPALEDAIAAHADVATTPAERAALAEFLAELSPGDGQPPDVHPAAAADLGIPGAATDAIPRFEHGDVGARSGQLGGRGQPRNPSSDDDDLGLHTKRRQPIGDARSLNQRQAAPASSQPESHGSGSGR